MLHIRAERINSQNDFTVCQRVVTPYLTRVNPSKSDCGECLKNTHKNKSFEITRIGAKYNG